MIENEWLNQPYFLIRRLINKMYKEFYVIGYINEYVENLKRVKEWCNTKSKNKFNYIRIT